MGVKGGWVPSPVALRLARPRCKSVDIAHLDQPGYKEYMEGVLRAGAVAARRRGQELIIAVPEGNRSNIGTKATTRTKHERRAAAAADRSFRVPVGCLPVQEDETEDGRSGGGGGGGGGQRGDRALGLQYPPLVSSTLAPGPGRKKQPGGPSSTGGRGATATTTAITPTALVKRGHHHHPVDKHGDCVGFGAGNGRDPVAISPSLQPREEEAEGADVFRLTTCDIEGPSRVAANDGGPRGLGKLAPMMHPYNSSNSTTAATADETLASEELEFRSKGARKVFKQTRRLLEALRTPASSCQVTSTGARRLCGGASTGGHSSVVIHHQHHNVGLGPAATAGAGGGKKNHGGGGNYYGSGGDDGSNGSGGSCPRTDAVIWRSPRGNRPARLAEVFRCVAPPRTVSIESEIVLHDSLSRASSGGGGGRDGDGGATGDGRSGGGTWDDLVLAWEVSARTGVAGRKHPRKGLQ